MPTTYSQYPGLARGPRALVVSMSKMTPAAPPCMALLRLQYAGVIFKEKVADARMEAAGISALPRLLVDGGPMDASSSTASDIKALSKPT